MDSDVESLDEALTRLMTGEASAVSDSIAAEYFEPAAFEEWFNGDLPSLRSASALSSLTSMSSSMSYIADPTAQPSLQDLAPAQYLEPSMLWPPQPQPFPPYTLPLNPTVQDMCPDAVSPATYQHYRTSYVDCRCT